MWLDRDVAQSDVVLASASAAFGLSVVGLLLFFDTGAVGPLIVLVAVAVTIGLVPWLLARSRGDGWQAFGRRADDPSTLVGGLALGVPAVALFVVRHLNDGGAAVDAGLGRMAAAGPAIGGIDPLAATQRGLEGVVLGVSAWLLMTFLAVRGRDGFRAIEMDVTEGLRTYGLILAGASLVLGLLRSLTGLGLVNAVLTSVAGLAIILLADRQVPPRLSVNRTMLLAPLIAWTVILFVRSGGGLFSGNLLVPLHRASASGMVVLAVASLVAAGRTRATILLVAAATLYPTCLGPLYLDGLFGLPVTC